jgi:isopentenyl-diphosphate delta-isomerase
MREEVILVDENDAILGTAEKIEAHLEGKLHRAFSIFILDSSGRLLLQKRAHTKYHSAGLWSNSCCSHPRPGESTAAAAHRRLKEEMGFDCELEKVFELVYRVRLDKDFIEYEFDHIFVGSFDGEPVPDPNEVEDWSWVTAETLVSEIRLHPDRYSYWLKASIDELLTKLSTVVNRHRFDGRVPVRSTDLRPGSTLE